MSLGNNRISLADKVAAGRTEDGISGGEQAEFRIEQAQSLHLTSKFSTRFE